MKMVLVKNISSNPVSSGTVTVASGEQKEVPADMVSVMLKPVKKATAAQLKKEKASEEKADEEKAAEKEKAENSK